MGSLIAALVVVTESWKGLCALVGNVNVNCGLFSEAL